MTLYLPIEENLEKAAHLLRSGELVSFPTETVYGLGADALNDEAVQKIYTLKGRPSNNPLICHVSSIDDAKKIAEISDEALNMMHHFWPGPLTLVVPLKEKSGLANTVTAGLNTVAIRMPKSALAQKLLKKVSRPIAAPSANLSTQISATSPMHVEKYFKDLFILADGNCEGGLESTILDLSTNHPKILREGLITKAELMHILDQDIGTELESKILKAPGMSKLHYSPNLPVRLNATQPKKDEAFITFGPVIGKYEHAFHLSAGSDLSEAAYKLYDALHQMDQADKFQAIAIMPIPNERIGKAINDRLMRAKK